MASFSARNPGADQDLGKDMQDRIESMTESKKQGDRKRLLNNPPIKDTRLKTTQGRDGLGQTSLTGAPLTDHTRPGDFDAPRIHGPDGTVAFQQPHRWNATKQTGNSSARYP